MSNRIGSSGSSDPNVVVQQIINYMSGIFQPVPIRGNGVITGVDYHPTQGYPTNAIATINGVANQRIEVGANHRLVVGEVWEFIADKDNVGRVWVPRRCLVTDQASIGQNSAVILPTIVIPSDGIVVSYDGGYGGTPAYQVDPSGGLVTTHVWINFRTIVTGVTGYDMFGSHIDHIIVQIREQGTTTWNYVNTISMRHIAVVAGTLSPVFLVLSAAFNPVDTSASVTLPAQFASSNFITNGPVYWGVENETFEGTFNGTNAITGITNRTADSGSIASHPSGSQVTLYSGQIDMGGLRSSTSTNTVSYELQMAAVKAGAIGPYTAFIPFSGYLITSPPAHVTSYVVNQIKTGTNLTWVRPSASNIKQFNIYRSTISVTDDTNISDHSSLPGTMRKIAVVSKNSTTFVVPVADTAGIYYQGNYFGVEVEDTTGNYSLVRWTLDTSPPPVPSGVTFLSVPNGIQVRIDPVTDTAHLDEGFKEFILYYNNAGSGTTGTELTRSTDLSFIYATLAISSQTYYQVASADWNNNISVLDTTKWQYVASLYTQDSWPTNGNFQDPDPTTPAPGASSASRPRFWTFDPQSAGIVAGSSHGWSNLRYKASGGGEGNRVVSIDTVANNSDSAFVYLITSALRTLPGQKTPTLTFWVYSTAALTGTGKPGFIGIFDTFTNDDGTGSSGSGTAGTVGATSLPAATWTKITIPLTSVFSAFPGGVTGTIRIGIAMASTGTNPSSTIYIDSVNITFS